MLGNLRDLNWPECAKNTFFPPQALLLSFQYIWLVQWQIIFITLEKLYSSRKTGCVPCLIFWIRFPSIFGGCCEPSPVLGRWGCARRFGAGVAIVTVVSLH